jgi:hypothetical protein
MGTESSAKHKQNKNWSHLPSDGNDSEGEHRKEKSKKDFSDCRKDSRERSTFISRDCQLDSSSYRRDRNSDSSQDREKNDGITHTEAEALMEKKKAVVAQQGLQLMILIAD